MANKKPRNDWKGKALQLEREKAETDRANERLQRQINSQKAEEKKRWSCITYCENCLVVCSVSVPPEVTVTNMDCINCRVRGMCKLVREIR